MIRRRIGEEKRGESDMTMSEVVILLATIFFFSVLLFFISKASNSSLFYEEVYAKKIGLTLESSIPGEIHEIDVTKAYEIAKANGLNENSFQEKFFTFEENTVRIKLSTNGGYNFVIFTKREIGFVDKAKPTYVFINKAENTAKLILKVTA